MATRTRILTGAALLLGIGVLVLVVREAERGGIFRDDAAEGRTRDMLTRPLRLEAPSDRLVSEFLEGIRTFHYRASPLGEAAYRDRFFDTEDGALARAGYSYRFRERIRGTDGSAWSVRLERSPEAGGSGRVDVRSEVPEALARSIVEGDWGRAVTGGVGLPAPDRLRAVLGELGLPADRLAPRVVGEIVRTRRELTDKGRRWFELDVEKWTFREPGGARTVSFTDLVLDTVLKKGDPEIERRVNTMDMLVRTMFAFEETDRPPVARARARLAIE